MDSVERRKLVREAVAWLREHEANHADDADHDGPVPFRSFAEAIAYYVAVARERGVDEAAFIEIVLTVVQLNQESLLETADVLAALGYRDVDRLLRRLAKRAQPRSEWRAGDKSAQLAGMHRKLRLH